MEHFVTHSQFSKKNPVILVNDNYESHLPVDAMDNAKDHGVYLITLPPLTSNRTQPLDLSVFGPMKT